MAGQDFVREDNLDTERLNRALWHGLRAALSTIPAQCDDSTDFHKPHIFL